MPEDRPTWRQTQRDGHPFDRRREVVYILGAFLLYELSQLWHVGDPLVNARALWAWEQRLHLDIEPALQAWTLDNAWLGHLFAWYYLPMHIVPFVALFLYHFIKRTPQYIPLRNVSLASIVPGFVLFILVPLTPPRHLASTGMRDLVAEHGAIGHTTPFIQASANQTGAFPSEHLIWAMIVAWALVRLHDRRWWPVAVAHVVITSVAVMATGHHYLIDVLAGIAIAGAAIVFVELHLGPEPVRLLTAPSKRIRAAAPMASTPAK